jgi:hypothetical protein
MKKLITSSLVLGLTLLIAGGTLAAVHNFTGDFSNPFLMSDFSSNTNIPDFEGWYYIEKDTPSATVRGSFPKDANHLGVEYLQNDQTFVNLSYRDPDHGDSIAYLKGSYLFDANWFAGLDFASDDDNSQTTFAPGYRFNIDDNCYVAVSMDYAVNHDATDHYKDSGLVDLEANGRYYTKDSRVYGQIIIPNDDVTIKDDIYFHAGGAYKYADNIVFGANFTSDENGDSTLDIGCTTAYDELGIEGKLVFADAANGLDINALYSFADNIRAGLEIAKVEHVSDPYLTVKAKYTIDDQNSAYLYYQFENNSTNSEVKDGVISLRWDIAVK